MGPFHARQVRLGSGGWVMESEGEGDSVRTFIMSNILKINIYVKKIWVKFLMLLS